MIVDIEASGRALIVRALIVVAVTSAVGPEVAVAGRFVASVRVGGEELRASLSDLSLDLLRRCAPVRTAGVYRRQRLMPGLWFSATVGRFLEYESLLERDWMLLMDFDREVEWICEQPLRLRYRVDDRPVSHVPDLLCGALECLSCATSRLKSVSRIRCSRLRSRRPGWRAPRRAWATGFCRSLIVSCW